MGNAKGTREERRAAAIVRNGGVDKKDVPRRSRKLDEIERMMIVERLIFGGAIRAIRAEAEIVAPAEARKGTDQ